MNISTTKLKSIHDTDESRPMEELMLSKMSFWKFLRHFGWFFAFIFTMLAITSMTSSNAYIKIGLVVLVSLLGILSLVPWIIDLRRR